MPPKRTANTKSKKAKKAKSGKDEKEAPYDRLHPSTIRLPCNHKFEVAEEYKRAGGKENKEDEGIGGIPQGALLHEYQLCAYDPEADAFEEEAIRMKFSAPVTKNLSLPNLAVGTAQDLKDQMESTIPRKVSGLVRGIHVSPEFKTLFHEERFSPSYSIIVVPYLSAEEEREYKENPIEFNKKMCNKNRKWLSDPKRKFWVCDGATRFTLCKEFGYSLQCMFMHPRIPYHHACMLAIGSNEGTGHSHNETLFLDKVRAIGAWQEQNFTQGQIADMAFNWGPRSRISRYNQCFEAIYGEEVASFAPKIIEMDLNRPEDKRIWSNEAIYLSKVSKNLKKEGHWADFLLEVSGYGDDFFQRLVEIGCSKSIKAYGGTSMLRYQWVFFMRLELIKAVNLKISESKENERNKEALKVANEQLAKLKSGEYDHFIRSKLAVLEGNTEYGKNPDAQSWTAQNVLDQGNNLIIKPWFRTHWKSVHSKMKKHATLDLSIEKIRRCIMTQADSTDLESMTKAMEDCYRLLPETKDMHHVVLTSPPWGVLRSGQIVDHGEEEAENVDTQLTQLQIGYFAGIIHKLFPAKVTVLLHLPIMLVEVYKQQFEANGFTMMRMPLTVVHTGGMRSKNFRASNFIRNSNHFIIFVKADCNRPEATYHDAKKRFPNASVLKQLFVSGITLKDNMVHNIYSYVLIFTYSNDNIN